MNYKNKYIADAMNAVNTFFEASKEAEPQLKALPQNYAGGLLEQKRQAIIDSVKEKQRNAQEAVRLSYEKLEERVNGSFSVLEKAIISEDFEFLKLPVILDEKQLGELAERNKDNDLFIQALNQYAQKYGYEEVFESHGKRLRNALADYKHATKGIFDAGDPWTIAGDLRWDMIASVDIIEAADDTFGA